jgi:tetratricopeptide (TPR) repeat protein
MKKNIELKNSVLIFVLLNTFVMGCSPTANGPVALFYHNMTSHYNAYYLGQSRMKDLETGIYSAQKDNFNKIIDLYPKIDSNTAKSHKDALDKIIRNTSLPIQWHKPSKWIDDCYLLLGKCRFYDADWDNAIATFSYIQNKYKGGDVTYEALIWLMRVYMEQKEWDQARTWGDFLEQQYLSPANAGQLSVANSFYYLKNGDLQKAFEKIIIGADFIKPKSYRAKTMFVAAQIAQKLGNNKDAHTYFKKSTQYKKNYDLWFHATLFMYQMKELKNIDDQKKVMKYYQKLLSDFKNVDYKDKIYYEIALFEQKRNNLQEALVNFKKSVSNSTNNSYLKSYSYLKIAEIYYEKYQDFENAKHYYDSTMLFLDRDVPEYPKSFKRQRILAEFVKQLKIVIREDSLLKLARMDSMSLRKLVDKTYKENLQKEKEAAKLKRKLELEADYQKQLNSSAFANTINNNILPSSNDNPNSKWYFYNEGLVAAGKIDFQQKWQNRANEDNWRRIEKDRDENTQDTTTQKNLTAASVQSKTDTTLKNNKTDKPLDKYYQDIPLSPIMRDSSEARLKRSLFKLSNIYNFNLEEYPNSIKNYERYIAEFPQDEKRPEAMYAVYLICKNKRPNDSCVNVYKNKLLKEYPRSLYAKLVINPNYLQENKILSEKLKFMYRNAFEKYKIEDFLGAINEVTAITREYPENDIDDRLRLLKIMIIGKTQSIKNYQDSLKNFIDYYQKSSDLVPYAKDLLEKSLNLVQKNPDMIAQKQVLYDIDLNYPHYFCTIFNQTKLGDSLVNKFTTFNSDYYSDFELKTVVETINDSASILVIKSLPNKIQAMNYYVKHSGKSSPLFAFDKYNFEYFIITDKNFDLMVDALNHKSYLPFFKRNYLKQ